MKKIFLLFSLIFVSAALFAQIENVRVETYYVSDSLDATDTTDGRSLEAGSKTYRIYIDLQAGSKIKKIYGDANHTIKISSTANFYNNINRSAAFFGYLFNKSWYEENPTIGLDSWLTLGLANKSHAGVRKADDKDGSFVGGANNAGGTGAVSGGILRNNDVLAGKPLTEADGLIPNKNTLGQWVHVGFTSPADEDTTAFGTVNIGSEFISNSAYLLQANGVSGADTVKNEVLVAQITTKGELSFELNLEVVNSEGKTVRYVANGDTLLSDEAVSPFLKYPLACGCTDPTYLEFNNAYSCLVSDSCKTKIVFGCMDTTACNYSAAANYNLANLCCYPGYCNDRNLDAVCPPQAESTGIVLYPNPASDRLNFEIVTPGQSEMTYKIFNAFGTEVKQGSLGRVSGETSLSIDQFTPGVYVVRVFAADGVINRSFLKN